jgi:DNA-binding NarL/FixJ family response regulator
MGTEALPGGRPARLVIVDDHELAREGLRDILTDVPDIEIVGEAADGQEALKLCRHAWPDLVLMDLRMPRMDGLEATREIKREYPKVGVLVMTMHENPDYLLEALRAGAAGYLLKDADHDDVVAAIRGVLSGESPIAPELAARLLRRLALEERERKGRSQDVWERRGGPYTEPLTPREQEVLGLMKLGHTNRMIAQTLVISPGTAKNHVEHIIQKLGVSDRTQAVVKALELGILELSE